MLITILHALIGGRVIKAHKAVLYKYFKKWIETNNTKPGHRKLVLFRNEQSLIFKQY